MAASGPLQCHVLRLKPGAELKSALAAYATEHGITSAFIVTCVGSVQRATLRFASDSTVHDLEGPFEIISLVGTVSGGDGHLHVCLSDKYGAVVGGHVLGGMIIYTTAEIVLGYVDCLEFSRQPCSLSGWPELVVNTKDAK